MENKNSDEYDQIINENQPAQEHNEIKSKNYLFIIVFPLVLMLLIAILVYFLKQNSSNQKTDTELSQKTSEENTNDYTSKSKPNNNSTNSISKEISHDILIEDIRLNKSPKSITVTLKNTGKTINDSDYAIVAEDTRNSKKYGRKISTLTGGSKSNTFRLDDKTLFNNGIYLDLNESGEYDIKAWVTNNQSEIISNVLTKKVIAEKYNIMPELTIDNITGGKENIRIDYSNNGGELYDFTGAPLIKFEVRDINNKEIRNGSNMQYNFYSIHSKKSAYNYFPIDPGEYELEVVIDSENKYHESNEGNNTLVKKVIITE